MAISRRRFLSLSMGALALATVSPARLSRAGLLERLFGGAGRETPPITPNRDFFITSYDLTPTISPERWTLNLRGLVRQPAELTYDDLLKQPQTRMISTLECIGNPVGGDTIGTAEWEGVRLNALLDEVGVGPKGLDVVLRSADGYSDSILLSRAMRDEILVATRMNGVPLPPEHGYPARLIVPGIYGMKNVKWLTGIEIVPHDYQGHWQERGWPDDAFVKLSSRIDLPGDRETIVTPRYTLKGIAYGGVAQIQRVEVSTDGGRAWQHAAPLSRLSPYAWTLWTYEWAIPKPGEYTLMVRATNDDGLSQTLQPGAPPAGSTGIHAITVSAAPRP